jgi:hypothetical protein
LPSLWAASANRTYSYGGWRLSCPGPAPPPGPKTCRICWCTGAGGWPAAADEDEDEDEDDEDDDEDDDEEEAAAACPAACLAPRSSASRANCALASFIIASKASVPPPSAAMSDPNPAAPAASVLRRLPSGSPPPPAAAAAAAAAEPRFWPLPFGAGAEAGCCAAPAAGDVGGGTSPCPIWYVYLVLFVRVMFNYAGRKVGHGKGNQRGDERRGDQMCDVDAF